MGIKEYYQSVVNDLEKELLSTDEKQKESLAGMKSFLKEINLVDSDIKFILSSMDYFYSLGEDHKFYEVCLKNYKKRVVELD
ncbi:hypothetical protein OCD85_27235 [Bacillus pacificus]|uniref:hypothetical protein n=1 Tax=Bacillus cereus group TaxID=86661 RepID=UPI0021CDAF1B|nr:MULTISPECIES: hypothetical protein [Bacillus cereus group]MCU5364607.1 hypothetical protein [Bacillus pacificus]MCU5402839.1 hypothetical protein [Bacillus pacificus]MDA1963612.1 hypothetical protein [Bacillus cereus group sp. BcHK10]